MRTDGNTSMREVWLATLAFVLIEIVDPLGMSTASDRVSADFTQRIIAYCYDNEVRGRILVMLIRGDELAAISRGWPLRLDIYAHYLEWLAEFRPAVVFLDIGLIKGGSVGSLDVDPCRPCTGGEGEAGSGGQDWLIDFAEVLAEVRERYTPVLLTEPGSVRLRLAPPDDRIPLVLASANPALNQWLTELRLSWEAGGPFSAGGADRPVAGARDLLPDCLNEVGTAVPVQWPPEPGYPLRILTVDGSDARKPVYEPSAAYLLYRAFCQQQALTIEHAGSVATGFEPGYLPAGCDAARNAELLQPDLDLSDWDPEPLMIDWGRLARADLPADSLWQCTQRAGSIGFFDYLARDLLRGLGEEGGHTDLCPFHPTVPFVYGEPWPDGLGPPAASISGRIVIIGTDIPGYLDRVETPVHGPYPGPLMHAMVVDNLLQSGAAYLKPAPAFLGLTLNDLVEALAVFASVAVGWLFRQRYLFRTDAAAGATRTRRAPGLPRRPVRRAGAGYRLGRRVLLVDFARWHECRDGDVVSARIDGACHNCKVQEMAFKLALGTMAFIFAAYYVVASTLRINPLFDFLLPAIISLINLRGALAPALIGIASGFTHLLTRGIRVLRRSAAGQPSIACAWPVGFGARLVITAVFGGLAILVALGCGTLAWTESLPIWLLFVAIVFWLSDGLVEIWRRFEPFSRRLDTLINMTPQENPGREP